MIQRVLRFRNPPMCDSPSPRVQIFSEGDSLKLMPYQHILYLLLLNAQVCDSSLASNDQTDFREHRTLT